MASRIRRAGEYALLGIIALIFLLPVWSMVVTALTSEGTLFSQGATLWPAHPTLVNFRHLLGRLPFLRWYLNSTVVAVLFTLGQLFSCTFAAFALGYFRFRGSQAVLILILATMMLPFQVLMVPLFLLMKALGWLNTLVPLWAPAFFGDITGAFGVFLLRQAFLQIPRELAEAASLDGASPWRVFTRIYAPLARPFVIVLAVFSFMTAWNDFVRPIVYITSTSRMTVTGGLSYFQTQFSVNWGGLMAGTLLAMLPTMVLYLVAQRHFTSMTLTTGLKG